MKRYQSNDLFTLLEGLVDKHVQNWKTDFDYDKEIFKCAVSDSDKDFIWMLRENGTQCEKERLSFIDGTRDNIECNYYLPWDEIKAFYVHIDGMKDNKVFGSVYPVDKQSLLEEIKKYQCRANEVMLHQKDGEPFIIPYDEYNKRASFYYQEHDIVKREYRLNDADEYKVAAILREHEDARRDAKEGKMREILPEKNTIAEIIAKASAKTGGVKKENQKGRGFEVQI